MVWPPIIKGTWCTGITPAACAEGLGLNPQCVHLNHDLIRTFCDNILASIVIGHNTLQRLSALGLACARGAPRLLGPQQISRARVAPGRAAPNHLFCTAPAPGRDIFPTSSQPFTIVAAPFLWLQVRLLQATRAYCALGAHPDCEQLYGMSYSMVVRIGCCVLRARNTKAPCVETMLRYYSHRHIMC